MVDYNKKYILKSDEVYLIEMIIEKVFASKINIEGESFSFKRCSEIFHDSKRLKKRLEEIKSEKTVPLGVSDKTLKNLKNYETNYKESGCRVETYKKLLERLRILSKLCGLQNCVGLIENLNRFTKIENNDILIKNLRKKLEPDYKKDNHENEGKINSNFDKEDFKNSFKLGYTVPQLEAEIMFLTEICDEYPHPLDYDYPYFKSLKNRILEELGEEAKKRYVLKGALQIDTFEVLEELQYYFDHKYEIDKNESKIIGFKLGQLFGYACLKNYGQEGSISYELENKHGCKINIDESIVDLHRDRLLTPLKYLPNIEEIEKLIIEAGERYEGRNKNWEDIIDEVYKKLIV